LAQLVDLMMKYCDLKHTTCKCWKSRSKRWYWLQSLFVS